MRDRDRTSDLLKVAADIVDSMPESMHGIHPDDIREALRAIGLDDEEAMGDKDLCDYAWGLITESPTVLRAGLQALKAPWNDPATTTPPLGEELYIAVRHRGYGVIKTIGRFAKDPKWGGDPTWKTLLGFNLEEPGVKVVGWMYPPEFVED